MARTCIDFGIDLGTTNSTIAVFDGLDAKVVTNKVGSTVTPSAVWINKRGAIHVGQEAKLRTLIDDPENGDLEFKLRMGLGEEGNKVFARSGQTMSPEQLSAEVLKSLRVDVRSDMGEELETAVITVPAAFENPSTTATMRAAQLAGFETSPLLLEPVAASLAYGFQSQSENVYWLTYDFGGGTFDAAVLRIRDGFIQVVNHDGDNFLGGKLLDWDIVTRKLVPSLTAAFNLPDLHRGNPRWTALLGKLKYYAELAKVEVCRSRAEHEIWIEDLCEDDSGKVVDFGYTLTPSDVEETTKPYVERSLSMCRSALKDSELGAPDLDRVLMVGGTSLNPWVREAVESELGTKLEFGIDPVTVVARGAAIFAGTQPLHPEKRAAPQGTWRIEIEHSPVGNVADPDIGGRVVAPAGQDLAGHTVELVDEKGGWRSGRLRLGAEGVFMTQLYAERKQRNEYVIELCDPTGNRLPCSPERVSYTIGVVPEERPPAAMTIGVGLANGGVATFIRKGDSLPARRTMDHTSMVPLRAGEAGDELRIPLLEGEHTRAERNHGIGALVITGADISRDLPAGSQIEVTLSEDKSMQLRLEAFIPRLNEDFEAVVDLKMKHEDLHELRRVAAEERERLADVRARAHASGADEALEVLQRIEEQGLFGQIDGLVEAAATEVDALPQLDRLLRAVAADLDEAEDALEWPALVQEARSEIHDAEDITQRYDSVPDGAAAALRQDVERAIESRDPTLLRRYLQEAKQLQARILYKQPAFHVGGFEWLTDRRGEMQDPTQAERLIAQGRRAIEGNDIDQLESVNRQLVSLLPRDVQEEAQHANIGGTIVRE